MQDNVRSAHGSLLAAPGTLCISFTHLDSGQYIAHACQPLRLRSRWLQQPGFVPAQNILVRGNTMRNNPYGGLWVGGYSDDAGFVTDVIVTRNTFQKNGTVEDGFYGEIYQTNVTNLKLSDNTFQ